MTSRKAVEHVFGQKKYAITTLVMLSALLCGCAAAAEVATEDNPARVEPIPGSDRSRVILTEEGASRVGIQTRPIGVGTHGGKAVIPLDAVLYDKDGKTWTYTTTQPLTFVPEEVVIARVDGDSAILTSGPAPGTEVVTVGAAELVGAEDGVPGE